MFRPAVDASASRSLPDSIPGAEPRLLAPRLLERTLLRLGRAGVVVERRLAPGLSRIHGRRLYRLLGYVRLADYLTERLGMSLRRCQAILRLERALAALPRLAQALEAGEVSVSKLEVAAAAATPVTEAAWLDLARRLPLAYLREAARALARADVPSAPGGAPAPGGMDATSPPDSVPASDAACGTSASSVASALPIEQDEPGGVISFTAPAPVVAIWHWTLDLVRRVAGQQEPAWRCAEFLAAEFLSGVPDTACESPRGAADPASVPSDPALVPAAPAPARPACTADLPADDTPAMSAWMEASAAVREALASIGASADPEAILSERPPVEQRADSVAGIRDDELDAWELDADLRRLVRLRQSLAWRQGRLLATFASLRLHRDLGFDTFDDWAGDRLAMSPRRARYLVSLDRRLRDLALLADAYRRGLVSWCQARLLIRVVRPATQSRWIRYARQVTVRRLEDVITDCEVSTAEFSATAASSASAHIGASPLPPIEPSPADAASMDPQHADPPPGKTASLARDPALLHTSAPPFDPASIRIIGFDRRTWRRISFWCPLDVASLWDGAIRSCRAAAGHRLGDWECFLLFVRALRDTWENQEDPHWRRRYRILERDGWRCKAPGCTSRSGLNSHHITFRSQQGGDDAANLVTLCVGHHQQGLHEGRIRCFGRAPDALWWDMGVKPGGEPLARYFGDRLVKRGPFVPVAPAEHVVARAVALPQHVGAPAGRLFTPAPRVAVPPTHVASAAAPATRAASSVARGT
ncbi:MAG: hypothetical protein AUG03_03010 [Acidobacteria bacterium 13_1_20CM_2_68_14]|nr:MAG: hypothetical protein AUG03_03010 [Acidobacteria bacterium 13_1_20CM_2_68_14]